MIKIFFALAALAVGVLTDNSCDTTTHVSHVTTTLHTISTKHVTLTETETKTVTISSAPAVQLASTYNGPVSYGPSEASADAAISAQPVSSPVAGYTTTVYMTQAPETSTPTSVHSKITIWITVPETVYHTETLSIIKTTASSAAPITTTYFVTEKVTVYSTVAKTVSKASKTASGIDQPLSSPHHGSNLTEASSYLSRFSSTSCASASSEVSQATVLSISKSSSPEVPIVVTVTMIRASTASASRLGTSHISDDQSLTKKPQSRYSSMMTSSPSAVLSIISSLSPTVLTSSENSKTTTPSSASSKTAAASSDTAAASSMINQASSFPISTLSNKITTHSLNKPMTNATFPPAFPSSQMSVFPTSNTSVMAMSTGAVVPHSISSSVTADGWQSTLSTASFPEYPTLSSIKPFGSSISSSLSTVASIPLSNALPTTRATPTTIHPSSTTATVKNASTLGPKPSTCGESGMFTLNWDDEPIFDPSPTDPITFPPVFNPYHHLFFSNGYAYAPPPDAPFKPISLPHMAVFLPNGSSQDIGSPSAAGARPGELGAGPRAYMNAYWFNADSAWLGCDNDGPESCLVEFVGFKYDDASKTEVARASYHTLLDPCPGFQNCALTQVDLPKEFNALSGLQIAAAVNNAPVIFWLDDLSMGWFNNTCEAGLLRQMSRK